MTDNSSPKFPLVSVVIPCYNHGYFLPDAIESVLEQTYPNLEIIVIDDGSTDNTREVAERYGPVKYVFQKNQGLSAARNTGILHSKGEFLVFSDADDLIYKDAVTCNIDYLQKNPGAAFVSGAYDLIRLDKSKIKDEVRIVSSDHYIDLLKSNYIGMHGTVMYRRWVFDEFTYDVTLKACEDYDLYLKVARKYPVIHHSEIVASYRMHSTNMSGNALLMLQQSLLVLKRQKRELSSSREKKAYRIGVKGWIDYYGVSLYCQLRSGELQASKASLKALRQHMPQFYIKFLLARLFMRKSSLKKIAPDFSLRFLNKMGLYNTYQPAVGKVHMGDLKRRKPLSDSFGFDRGLPIDRYYIENFLASETSAINGRVLEIGDNDYTVRFGGKKVVQSDILHVNDANPNATIIGDLSNAPQIPDNSFDCIILTQTLHLVYHYQNVLKTCVRILKPGGSLLLTVPGITPVDIDEWEFMYSFTKRSVQKMLSEVFPPENLKIENYGNVLAASAFLYGMALSELKKEDLDYLDPRFQVIIAARAVKSV